LLVQVPPRIATTTNDRQIISYKCFNTGPRTIDPKVLLMRK